jgi:hypothetical protein
MHHENGYGVQNTVRRGRGVVCIRLCSVCNLLSRRHVRGSGRRQDRLHHDGGYGVQSTVRSRQDVVRVGHRAVRHMRFQGYVPRVDKLRDNLHLNDKRRMPRELQPLLLFLSFSQYQWYFITS